MLSPQQKKCWEAYIDPKSETFGNGKQSALNAGYGPYYAETMTTQPWFEEKVRRLNMLSKAEKALDEAVTADIRMKKEDVNSDVWRIKMDAAKFIAETQGKAEGYSKRQEVTGADGAPAVVFQISEAIAVKNGLTPPPNDPKPSPEPHSG